MQADFSSTRPQTEAVLGKIRGDSQDRHGAGTITIVSLHACLCDFGDSAFSPFGAKAAARAAELHMGSSATVCVTDSPATCPDIDRRWQSPAVPLRRFGPGRRQ